MASSVNKKTSFSNDDETRREKAAVGGKMFSKGLVKKYRGGGGVGRSREGVGHEVLSLVQGVGCAIFSYP